MDEWTRAIAEALGCERVNERDSWAGRPYCAEHGYLWLSDTDTCPTTERIAAALASLIEARYVAAEALEDAADKFQWGAWIDVLSGGLVQRRTDGEAVVRWLRERSRALRESP